MPRLCYAKSLGDCSGKISLEHFISASLLQTLGSSGVIEGQVPSEPERQMPISAASGAARVLCRRHNSLLSKVDAPASKFLVSCRDFDRQLDLSNQALATDSAFCDGVVLERWLAKALLGLDARGNGIQSIAPANKAELLRVAFGLTSPTRPKGLYLEIADGSFMFSAPAYSLVALKNPLTKECLGVRFAAGSICWLYPLGNPDHLRSISYRPAIVDLHNGARKRRLSLGWPAGADTQNAQISLRRESRNDPDLFSPTWEQSFPGIRSER